MVVVVEEVVVVCSQKFDELGNKVHHMQVPVASLLPNLGSIAVHNFTWKCARSG